MKTKQKPSPAKRLGRLKQLKYLAPYIDHDYLEKLTPEQLEWLVDFDEEFYQGRGQRVWSKRHCVLTLVIGEPIEELNRDKELSPEEIIFALQDSKNSRGG